MNDELKRTQDELSTVSPSLCLAKWLHSSIHFHYGLTHSCYHNPPHKMSRNEVIANPKAIYLTEEKRAQKLSMLKGQRGSECSFCWKIESQPYSKVYSDRLIKSNSFWAKPYFAELLEKNFSHEIEPTYLEISFSNVCNLKCIYCGPHNSSAWVQDLKTKGPYQSINHATPLILSEEDNVFIQAFWKLWPDLLGRLEILRITGGEPVLSKNFWQLLDQLESTNSKINLVINSNLATSHELIIKLVGRLESLIKKGSVKSIKIITSMEAIGEKAEFIRNGLNFELFIKNITYLMKLKFPLHLSITSTINIFSLDSYIDYLDYFLKIRIDNPEINLVLDPSPLKYPDFLSIEFANSLITKKFKVKLDSFIKRYRTDITDYEYVKLIALREMVGSGQVSKLEKSQKLRNFCEEHKSRNDLDAVQMFKIFELESVIDEQV